MAVSAGDKLEIRASEWNEVQEVLRWFKGNKLQLLAKELESRYEPSVVWVKNTTNTDRAAFDVLALNDIAFDVRIYEAARYENLHLHGAAPSTEYGRYCVLQEPARANDGFARAIVSGVTLAKLNITNAADVACDIENGVTTYLKTGYVGTSRIIFKNTGTGSSNKWGVVRLGDMIDNFVGKPTGTIAAGSSGDVAVWDATFAGALGPTVTNCYNHSATSLTSSDKVAGCYFGAASVISKIC